MSFGQVGDAEMASEGADSEDEEENSEDEGDSSHKCNAPEAAEPADDPMDLPEEDTASVTGAYEDADEKVHYGMCNAYYVMG